MVASADADWSKEAHADSFLLSNISAQHPDLNQQGWVKIEKASRALAMKYNIVNIITGTVYLDENETKTIGSNRVAVPSHYYKVVYAPEYQKMWAWIVPNQPVPSNKAYKYRVTVDEVEDFAGIDLFNQLPLEQQSKIEGRKFDL
jgi:endonuclease G